MEDLVSSITEIVNSILNCDPSIYRIIITDTQGLEIAKYTKVWNRKPGEIRKKNPVKNPIYPLLTAICTNAEKFLGFLRKNDKSPFIFSWYFQRSIIFAASSPFGYIGVFCEPDVDQGLVKKILKTKTIQYNQLVGMVFRE